MTRPSPTREASDLRGALEGLLTFFARDGEDSNEKFERIAAEYYRDTGRLAPGKSEPMHAPEISQEARRELFDLWAQRRVDVARQALSAPVGDEGRLGPAALHVEAEGVREPAGVYVASRASVPARAEMWRTMKAGGYPIISTWIFEDGEGQTDDLGELWARIVHEVTASHGVILYVEPDDFPLKGAFVEVGIALGVGLPVVIVAPGVDYGSYGCRPIGSWMKHPLVSVADTVEAAFAALSAEPRQQSDEARASMVSAPSDAEGRLAAALAAYPKSLAGFSTDEQARLLFTARVDDLRAILGDLHAYRATLAAIATAEPRQQSDQAGEGRPKEGPSEHKGTIHD